MYENRFYRAWTDPGEQECFELKLGQSDLYIRCQAGLRSVAEQALIEVRRYVEQAVRSHELFLSALHPIELDGPSHPVIEEMVSVSRDWEVGPMASVAGAVAEFVGQKLIDAGSPSVIVENGGDIYCRAPEALRFALYAGEESPFAGKLAFEVEADDGVGVCTSSGRVGPSLSFGNADAVVVVAKSTAYADAAATAIANQIKSEYDIDPMLERLRGCAPLRGLLICCGERLGVFGNLTLSRR